MHECFRPGKGAVDDVDVMDCVPTQHESETYVPLRLQTCTEDRDGVDMGANVEDHGRGERSTESRQFFSVEESVGYASGGEKC